MRQECHSTPISTAISSSLTVTHHLRPIMNVLAVGASRNIGYYASLRLLEKGATVTFLLRSPSAFDGDSTIQGYVASGKAHLVKGDGLKTDDVRHSWEVAQSLGTDGRVDLVVFTVGTPLILERWSTFY